MSEAIVQHPSFALEDARAVLAGALNRFALDRIAISFSGAEDVVLIDLAADLIAEGAVRCIDGSSEDRNRRLGVFTLDTGRLHAETHRFIEEVRGHYGIDIEVLTPDADALTAFTKEKGLFSFYRDGHGECCAVRKIEPLRRKLTRLDAWITGQRGDQNVTRGGLPTEQADRAFSTPDHAITKFNPLANWRSDDVWAYIREREVPYNPLHDQGYLSIGCQPCTRPVGPGQHERDGRWWWESADDKECGLHAQNQAAVPLATGRGDAARNVPAEPIRIVG